MALRGKRLLVLNDEVSFLTGLTERLQAAGVKLYTAGHAAAALHHLEAERLDGIVALADRQHPGVPQFVANVRASRFNGRTPVCVIASEVDAESVKRLAALNVASIILAPTTVAEVFAHLQRIMSPPERPASYDVRFINAFLAAARNVLQFYLGAPPEMARPRLKDGHRAAGFVTGLIAFSANGQFGSLAASFERAFMDLLAAKTFGEEQPALDDATYADLAGEMCNQMLGGAMKNFEKLGVRMQAGLPEVVVGESHSIFHKVDSPIVSIPITSGTTTCVVEFAMGSVEADPPAETVARDGAGALAAAGRPQGAPVSGADPGQELLAPPAPAGAAESGPPRPGS